MNNSSNKGKIKLYCSNCNGNNHILDNFYHLYGFPPEHKNHKSNEKNKGKKKEYFAKETPSFTYEQLLTLLNNSDTQPKTNVIGLIIPFCSSCYIDQKLIENGSLIVISMTTWFCHLNYY